MQRIAIFGATSAIAEATARLWAAEGAALFLVARNDVALTQIAEDLRIRGASEVQTRVADLADDAQHQAIIEQIMAPGKLDIALIAHGTLSDQKACEADFELARRELTVNGLSVLSLCTHLANAMEPQGQGTLAVISSVAGDRGRQSNYVYGTAKAMVSTFLAGLRNRLHGHGVNVLTIKPGFVDTPMTAAFDKGPLWATPEQIAEGIVKGIQAGRNTLYLPWFWWGIMTIIRSIPEAIFKRLSL